MKEKKKLEKSSPNEKLIVMKNITKQQESPKRISKQEQELANRRISNNQQELPK